MGNLILFNANVITMDPVCPKAKVVVIRNNGILAVRRNNAFKEFGKGNTEKMIDCGGKTVLPGFIDTHCHLYALAESKVTLNLEPRNNVRSIPDIQKKIRGYLKNYLQEAG